jgi:hypothetical protein
VIIQNADGAIVTAHRGKSFDDLSGMARETTDGLDGD